MAVVILHASRKKIGNRRSASLLIAKAQAQAANGDFAGADGAPVLVVYGGDGASIYYEGGEPKVAARPASLRLSRAS